MTTDKFEKEYQLVQEFAEEFKELVHRYMPNYPDNEDDLIILMQMQEQTSCFSPWLWPDND